MVFGPHLTIDAQHCNSNIGDLDYVFRFLDTLPSKIGMTKIAPPTVFHYSGQFPEDKGITGTVIIAESHISFHSFTEKNFVFFDIFSCKPFHVEETKQLFLDAFDPQAYTYHILQRGQDFPRNGL